MIRVGILATGLTMRIGLREVLRSLADIEVVAEAEAPQGLPSLDVLVVAWRIYWATWKRSRRQCCC